MQKGEIVWWDMQDSNGVIQGENGIKYYFDDSVVECAKVIGYKANTLVLFSINDDNTVRNVRIQLGGQP